MTDFGIFRRGSQTRRAATPAQAVKLKHDGWRVDAAEVTDDTTTVSGHLGIIQLSGEELECLTVAELKQYAAGHEIDLGDAHLKAEILAEILAASEASQEAAEEHGDNDDEPRSADTHRED